MAADVLTNLVTSLGNNFASPITLAINLILSTLIGGIVLLILVEILGKKFKEKIHPANAFLVVLIITLITNLGILGLLSQFISSIPLLTPILPALVWIILIKIFFKEMKFTHVVLVGIIGYVISIYLVPYLVTMAMGFVPSFG